MAATKDDNLKTQIIENISDVVTDQMYYVKEVAQLLAKKLRISSATVNQMIVCRGEEGYENASLKGVRVGKRAKRVPGANLIDFLKDAFPSEEKEEEEESEQY